MRHTGRLLSRAAGDIQRIIDQWCKTNMALVWWLQLYFGITNRRLHRLPIFYTFFYHTFIIQIWCYWWFRSLILLIDYLLFPRILRQCECKTHTHWLPWAFQVQTKHNLCLDAPICCIRTIQIQRCLRLAWTTCPLMCKDAFCLGLTSESIAASLTWQFVIWESGRPHCIELFRCWMLYNTFCVSDYFP